MTTIIRLYNYILGIYIIINYVNILDTIIINGYWHDISVCYLLVGTNQKGQTRLEMNVNFNFCYYLQPTVM